MRVYSKFARWWSLMLGAFSREMRRIFADQGVIIFFIALPLLYPIVYTLIYNPEVADQIPIAVVDLDQTAQSRQLVADASATQAMRLNAYATDLAHARALMADKQCYGVLYIPEGYARRVGRGEQGVASFFYDMSLLLRYRTMAAALTDLQIATCGRLRPTTLAALGASSSSQSSTPVLTQAYFLGDITQGFASFVMPGIVVLILQQTLILGILMLAGGRRERLMPELLQADRATPLSALLAGRTLCYLAIYLPMTVYVLHYIPLMFSLPHLGIAFHYLPLILPMLLGAIFMAMALSPLCKERETSMLIAVFTSVVFLFLSGLTWPRYAMGVLWKLVGDIVPATWAVQAFVRIDSNGATLADNTTCYLALWALALLWCVVATLVERRKRVVKH